MTSKFTPHSDAVGNAVATERVAANLRDQDARKEMQLGAPQLHRFTKPLTTDELADAVGVRPQSIRKRHSQTGSYFGLVPVKLANRRLIFDPVEVEKFLRGEVLK